MSKQRSHPDASGHSHHQRHGRTKTQYPEADTTPTGNTSPRHTRPCELRSCAHDRMQEQATNDRRPRQHRVQRLAPGLLVSMLLMIFNSDPLRARSCNRNRMGE